MDRVEANRRLNDLFEEVDGLLDVCDAEHVRAHAYQLLRTLDKRERTCESASASQSERIASDARRHLEQSLPANPTIEQVASACGVSPTMLKVAFRETFGVPLGTWWRTFRIDQAQRQLLETEDTVAQVAASVGYLNPSKFSAAFRAQTGESPSAWRRTHQ